MSNSRDDHITICGDIKLYNDKVIQHNTESTEYSSALLSEVNACSITVKDLLWLKILGFLIVLGCTYLAVFANQEIFAVGILPALVLIWASHVYREVYLQIYAGNLVLSTQVQDYSGKDLFFKVKDFIEKLETAKITPINKE